MEVKQLYTKCLAQGAYYIENNGEAAVIDPLREVDQYLELAEASGAKINYIFETHFHADFVSGHLTLAKKTEAPIVYGPLANPSFDALIANDGQEFKVGKLTLKVLHTPGHTMESTTYLLLDENGKQVAIFTGDTLFIGDVGRPDLAQKDAGVSQEELAGHLYSSLRKKIFPLNDDVVVYPAHGAGSACGKNMSSETLDTLGNQKETNYALRADMTKEEFIEELTKDLLPPPAYFPENVELNKEGYAHIDTLYNQSLQALSVKDFSDKMNDTDVRILDVRHQDDFVEGFIKGSYFVGLNGSFAPWVGAVLKNTRQKLLVVCPAGKEKETITRLARVGFDNVLGYLNGGIDAWKNGGKPVEHIESISAHEALQQSSGENTAVVDVRKPSEFNSGHVPNAKSLPLDFLEEQLEKFPTIGMALVHCQSGYRSVIASSILKAKGYNNLKNVRGGYKALANELANQ